MAMTGCLPDRILWALFEGDGTHEDRAHLGSCGLCQWRARRLAHDLKVLEAVLRDLPPAAGAPAHGAAGLRWAAAVALVMAGLGLAWVRGGPAEDRSAAAHAADMPVLWALSSAVFADSVVESALVPTPSHELDVMAAALDEAVPCEWQPEGCWEDVMQ